MTLLSMCNNVLGIMGLPTVSSVVGSTDKTARQLKALLEREGRFLRDKYFFPILVKEGNITLQDGVSAYALPGDFDSFLGETMYDRSKSRPHEGISPSEWQKRQTAAGSNQHTTRFRIRGGASNRLHLYPTPTASEDGNTVYFEYVSRNWIKPVQWTSGANFTAGAYCLASGEIFQTSAGGTTGGTEPTIASPNDGTITWTHVNDEYNAFLADTDGSLIDEKIVEVGLQWRFMQIKGLPGHDEISAEYFDMLTRLQGKEEIPETLNMGGNRISSLETDEVFPDYGAVET